MRFPKLYVHLARTGSRTLPHAFSMGKKGKGAARPTVTPPETRTIFNRGEQYQAEMLTGNRARPQSVTSRTTSLEVGPGELAIFAGWRT